MTERDYLRIQRYRPYLQGRGPVFVLATWDTGNADWRGVTTQGYCLRQFDSGTRTWTTLFEGADFNGSPLHADDSDETLRVLLSFLTLRPGDTDAEYFENYTSAQLAYCDQHAEALSLFAMGEDA